MDADCRWHGERRASSRIRRAGNARVVARSPRTARAVSCRRRPARLHPRRARPHSGRSASDATAAGSPRGLPRRIREPLRRPGRRARVACGCVGRERRPVLERRSARTESRSAHGCWRRGGGSIRRSRTAQQPREYVGRPHPNRRRMIRPVTLFTGQWADMPLATLAAKAREWGYDGLELACWGDHFDVRRALAEADYCDRVRALLAENGLRVFAISNHLVGQCVCDPIDRRHAAIAPPHVWGDGHPEGVRRRAAEEMIATAHAAAKLGVRTVNGFTGSPIWHLLYSFP